MCGWDNNSICWFYWLVVRNVWWGNQEILGEGNRHDNIDPSFYYYCAYTDTKCVEREQNSGYYIPPKKNIKKM